MKNNRYFYLSTAFFVLVKREINRFLSLYKQTIIPGVISSALYIIVFGHALGDRIQNNAELEAAGGYMLFIIPLIAPPIIYAKLTSKPLKGVIKISSRNFKNFACIKLDDVF